MAWDPAPPATAALTVVTSGFVRRKAANKVSRAAASEPEVHHDTTSSRLVDVVALAGAPEPQALAVSARTASAAAARSRPFTPGSAWLRCGCWCGRRS